MTSTGGVAQKISGILEALANALVRRVMELCGVCAFIAIALLLTDVSNVAAASELASAPPSRPRESYQESREDPDLGRTACSASSARGSRTYRILQGSRFRTQSSLRVQVAVQRSDVRHFDV